MTDAPSAWAALSELAEERSGLLALDVGANTGQAASLLAPYFAQVVSYEPHVASYQVLSSSAPGNVRAEPLALSRRPGHVRLAVTSEAYEQGQLVTWPASAGHPEWGSWVSDQAVPCSTVDYEVGRGGVLPALVKVDTEGHEVEVLRGAAHTLALGYSAWFVEVHDQSYSPLLLKAFRRYQVTVIEHDYLEGDPRGEDHYYVVARPKG